MAAQSHFTVLVWHTGTRQLNITVNITRPGPTNWSDNCLVRRKARPGQPPIWLSVVSVSDSGVPAPDLWCQRNVPSIVGASSLVFTTQERVSLQGESTIYNMRPYAIKIWSGSVWCWESGKNTALVWWYLVVDGWWRWLRPDKRLKCAENERVKWGRMCWCFYPLYVSPGCSLIKMMMSRELPVLITFYLHFRLTSFWSHLKLNIYLRGHTRPGWRGWCCGGRKIIFICQLLIINLAKTPCRICEEVLIYGEKLVPS